jgi:hypothetical protein
LSVPEIQGTNIIEIVDVGSEGWRERLEEYATPLVLFKSFALTKLTEGQIQKLGLFSTLELEGDWQERILEDIEYAVKDVSFQELQNDWHEYRDTHWQKGVFQFSTTFMRTGGYVDSGE